MKYLAIALANQIYGLELGHVKEWLGYMNFTPLSSPAVSPAISFDPAEVGSLDLRGRRATVIDLRLRFSLPLTRTTWTSMVIVEVLDQIFALIVDNVLSIRNPSVPGGLDEKPFIPIDLIGCTTTPRRDVKLAA